MRFELVIEWLGFETGFMWGNEDAKWTLLKGEFVILTVGLKIRLSVG